MTRRIFALVLLALTLGAGSPASAQRVMTNFDPGVHGYKFSNSFINIFVGDWTTNGLCGGMVYSALDHYNARRVIPRQDRRPANGTPLQQHIYFRQVHSIERNTHKWAELGMNLWGVRSSEFFRWGLQGFDGGRLQELRQMIERGIPVPLGLQEYGEGTRAKNHQVLAIGYDLGGFTGTDRNHSMFGENAQNLRIFVYDPNFPGDTLTLRPHLPMQGFYYEEWARLPHGDHPRTLRNYLWRTYFVDMAYTPASPPRVSETNLGSGDGLARELWVELRSGSHRLPGGNSNLNVTINYEDGPPQVVRNINGGHPWVNNYWEHVPIRLNRAVHPSMISSVLVEATGTSNYTMNALNLRVLGGFEGERWIYRAGSDEAPLVRFAAQNRTFTAVHNQSLVRQVHIDIRTGSNPLPGGDQNLNVIVAARGSLGTENNANRGARWVANSNQRVTVTLPRPVRMSDINLVTLVGQVNGANSWTIESLRVSATREGGGPETVLVNQTGAPLHRFTASTRIHTANRR